MIKVLFWKVILFLFACLGLTVFCILFGLYGANKLSSLNWENCYLQDCYIINRTCKEICPDHQPLCTPVKFTCQYKYGNYSFHYKTKLYFGVQKYYIDENCTSSLICSFKNPNDTIYFSSELVSQSMGLGVFFIMSILVFMIIIFLLCFDYCWKYYYNKKESEDPMNLLEKRDNSNPLFSNEPEKNFQQVKDSENYEEIK